MSKSIKKGYELRELPINDLEPNAWNVNKESDATFARLQEEIRTVGFIDPIEVVPLDSGKYRIIGGEHRWRAALAVGLEEVPAVVLTDAKWDDVDLQKFVSLRVNTLKGNIDPEKFAKLYNEMSDKYGADALQGLMGFVDGKGFQKLLASVSKGLKGAPKGMQKEFDKRAKDAKTVEELTSILQELWAKYGDTVEQNFMVFTHGRKQHLYVSMDAKMKRAMEKVVEYCKFTKEDINEVMAPITNLYMKECEKRMSDFYDNPTDTKVPEDDPVQ